MRLAVISFTRAGGRLCVNLTNGLRNRGQECDGYVQERFYETLAKGREEEIYPVKEPVGAWTKRLFDVADGLIYIGAAGIAVRAIAPVLKDKMTDPAVVVVDELGHFAISLLSGHVGGANELAWMVAGICDARPVITTATDVNQKTAIDSWAARQGFWIGDRQLARQVSARVLEGDLIGFFSDFPLKSPAPDQYRPGVICDFNIWVTTRKSPLPGRLPGQALAEGRKLLRLIPRVMTVGIGCRKGIPGGQIEKTVRDVLEREQLDWHGVAQIASIDLKKQEEGLLFLSEKWGVPFVTFSALSLEQITEPVEESSFVRQVTGTGNVCERSALLGAGEEARLLVKKQAENGVTVAVAEGRKKWQRY